MNPTTENMAALQAIDNAYDSVYVERQHQLTKFGVQQLPDGTGRQFASIAEQAKARCDVATAVGDLTWEHVASEEFFEALAETEYEPLRAELIQTATVLLSWVVDLDRRQGALVGAHQPQLDLEPESVPA